MGVEAIHFQALVAAKKDLGEGTHQLLSLGYPDMVVPEDIIRLATKDAPLTVRKDSEEIGKWHTFPYPIFESGDIFKALDIVPRYIDIRATRGCEEVIDLNYPQPSLNSKFDIVLDPGTIEHCFDVANALRNVASFLKVGGFAIHLNPVSMVNHGFYSLNPTLYWDFYSQNGFEVVKTVLLKGNIIKRESMDWPHPPISRQSIPSECSILSIVRKKEERELINPLQSKYINSDLKG